MRLQPAIVIIVLASSIGTGRSLAATEHICPLEEHGGGPMAGRLVERGEAAFSALAEIAALLQADPATDWSRVDLDALREHLADMSRVIVDAEIRRIERSDGIEAIVRSANARTAQAIGAMLPAHAAMMNGYRDWQTELVPLADGVRIVVRTDDPTEALRLRGLGVAGFLVAGDHHRRHHLAIALGRPHGAVTHRAGEAGGHD